MKSRALSSLLSHLFTLFLFPFWPYSYFHPPFLSLSLSSLLLPSLSLVLSTYASTVVFWVSAHGKHTSQFWPAWALTWDITSIYLYRSCYIDPLKWGTWALTQEWALARDTTVNAYKCTQGHTHSQTESDINTHTYTDRQTDRERHTSSSLCVDPEQREIVPELYQQVV